MKRTMSEVKRHLEGKVAPKPSADDSQRIAAGYAPENALVEEAEEKNMLQVIKERDQAEWWADKLAGAIAHLLNIEIGEHTNDNCPWQNALENYMAETGYEVEIEPGA